MDLITPSVGLIFWTAVVFIILLVLLRSLAWKPILSAVKEREQSIEDALNAAKKAKEEMALLNAQNEKIMKEARAERDAILKEAREMKENIINEAKNSATVEANKLIENAKSAIQNEKASAMADIKNQVGQLSIEIAEKILTKELSDKSAQEALVNDVIDQVKFN
ncbi:F0F1 ATP synthase subunit B [Empedobacter falsenii]|jgi:F-type H+-transporting ATPase subunit b|uniref:ATP synthase subunit b n=1 Tax=Empedobacter falsenii TaxID=343874 RepID=A0A376FX13_9FLAO|nr:MULTISPECIES: F0F1 ATP synthase subunit B [Empedobacter]HAR71886.1 F0F1 ATP synthase subunit B [Flavobacteriaceae bacterium]MBY0065855.1 F0F1 ATP synthase subunit B [Empedobacter falsenii]MDH1883978.1 F0F1 ATP synthase subunit B [Empedobacter sp. GD03797]MDH2207017.1 F0F1 ATP synthase subunit B [Empedobacter sp. GD03644]MDM1042928.1 F0F1 ATP synthase subunit B [Empedobacter brevis]